MKRDNPFKQKKRQVVKQLEESVQENAEPNTTASSSILIQDQMYNLDFKPIQSSILIADAVLETPKSKQSESAIDYSENKHAVKVELDAHQQTGANIDAEMPIVGGFNRFKKNKSVSMKRQPLSEVEESETSGLHSSQYESQDSVQVLSDHVDYEAKYKALLRENT